MFSIGSEARIHKTACCDYNSNYSYLRRKYNIMETNLRGINQYKRTKKNTPCNKGHPV